MPEVSESRERKRERERERERENEREWVSEWVRECWRDHDWSSAQAILVIFGRSFLNFFVWKVLEKMKNDTILCACAVVITLETQKCRKKGPHFVEFKFFYESQ